MINLESKTASDCEREIRFLINEGQFFYAYDVSVKALEKYPDNLILVLLGALALINSGAVSRACKLLEPIQEQLETSDLKAYKLFELFQQCIKKAVPKKKGQSVNLAHQDIELFSDFAKTVQSFTVNQNKNKDIKNLKVAAEVYYKIWENQQEQRFLNLSKNLSLECFTLDNSVSDGIRAALLSWISGDKDMAIDLANKIHQLCLLQLEDETNLEDLSQFYFTLSLSQLLLGDIEAALNSCQMAMLHLNARHMQVVNMRNMLNLLTKHELQCPESILEVLKAPVIVIFAGQPIDPSDSEEVFFPQQIEHEVSRAIVSKLDEIDAEIGYCSAACGSDLIFIEAMLDRGAEVNIILPFAEEDFISARLRYAGHKWERRFKNALKLASSVTWSTKDPYLNDDELFRYNNLLIEGGARLRAESLFTIPQLMVVMDYLAPALAGSAADFMDQWADIASLHMIDLDELRENAETSEQFQNLDQENLKIGSTINNHTQVPKITKPRVVKSMLFADIVHYSKMREEQLPAIFEFLGAVKEYIQSHMENIDLVESWGDALYVAMSSTREMADYAVALCQALEVVDHKSFGLTVKPELRIGLHVGPVYEGEHPLTGRKIIFGQHVSRAARIEPITVPGEIYTSEHFVAVLKAEENAARHMAEATQSEFQEKYSPEYIGILELPKKFGNQAVYHLRSII